MSKRAFTENFPVKKLDFLGIDFNGTDFESPDSGRIYEFSFRKMGEVLRPAPGKIYLDVGNGFTEGLIDHHQFWEGDSFEAKLERFTISQNCAASLIHSFPEKITGHIKERDKKVEIITHQYPDFDAVLSSYLTLFLLEKGSFPKGTYSLSEYARWVDRGNPPGKANLAYTPYGVFYGMIGYLSENSEKYIKEKFFLNHLFLFTGLKFFDEIFSAIYSDRKFEDSLSYPDFYSFFEKFFSQKAEGSDDLSWRKFVERVLGDFHAYLEDLEKGSVYAVELAQDPVRNFVWDVVELTHRPGADLASLRELVRNRYPVLPSPEDERIPLALYYFFSKIKKKKEANQIKQLFAAEPESRRDFLQTVAGLRFDKRAFSQKRLASFLLLRNPYSKLYKIWARLDKQHSLGISGEKGFTALMIVEGRGEKPPFLKRYIMSIDPETNYTLKGLSGKLEKEEVSLRKGFSLLRSGTRRPGYNNPDPWFDGRGTIMENTIVDTPHDGTLISEERVISIVKDFLRADIGISKAHFWLIFRIKAKGKWNPEVFERAGFSYEEVSDEVKGFFFPMLQDFLFSKGKLVHHYEDENNILLAGPTFEAVVDEARLILIREKEGFLAWKVSFRPKQGFLLANEIAQIKDEIYKKIEILSTDMLKEGSFSRQKDSVPYKLKMLELYRPGEELSQQVLTLMRDGTEIEGCQEKRIGWGCDFISPQEAIFVIEPGRFEENKAEALLYIFSFALYNRYLSIDMDHRIAVAIHEEPKEEKTFWGKALTCLGLKSKSKIQTSELLSLRKKILFFTTDSFLCDVSHHKLFSSLWQRILEVFKIKELLEEIRWESQEIARYFEEKSSKSFEWFINWITILFLPITLLTGILGMNVREFASDANPESSISSWGNFWITAVVVLSIYFVTYFVLWFMKNKK